MSERKILIRTVPGTGFSVCIERFIASLRRDPLRTWLFLPTNRLIRTVKQRLIDEKISFIPDHICTLEQFCEYLLERYGEKTGYIPGPAARIILSDLLHEKKKELPLFFAQGIPSPGTLQDLQTLISVITRRIIHYPECLGDLQSPKSSQIHTIISAYLGRLNDENCVDKDSLLSWVCSFMGHASPDLRILNDVYIYGLFEPLPLEQQVINAIADSCTHIQYFNPDGDDPKVFSDTGDWFHPDSEDTIPCSERDRKRTRIFNAGVLSSDQTLDLEGISSSGFLDPKAELRAIAEEISRLQADGIPYDQVVVAFPDLRYALLYAEEIFPDYAIPYHSSSTPLLTHSPLVAFLLKVFEFPEKGFRYEELIRIMQSPFLSFSWLCSISGENTQEKLKYAQFDLICRTYGITGGYVDWEEQFERIRSLIAGEENRPDESLPKNIYGPKRPLPIPEILLTLEGSENLIAIFRKMGRKMSIPDHIKVYKDLLDEIGAPVPDENPITNQNNKNLTPAELLVVRNFNSILDELLLLSRSGRITGNKPDQEVSFSVFLYTLRLMFQDRTSDPDVNENGVLLTGIRETVHQQYPYLFLASLNEGMIPRLTTRLPFTNASENSRMETRTLQDILRQERYQFIAALLAGNKVYLSYYQHRDERTTLSSSFLDQLEKIADLPPWNQSKKGVSAGSIAAFASGRLFSEEKWEEAVSLLSKDESLSSILQRIQVERNFRFRLNRSEYDGILRDEPDIRELLDTRFYPDFVWSSSMLETYAKCPFRFYLERVVRIKPLPDLGTEISPTEKGNLIHSVLFRFKRQMLESGKLPLKHDSYDEAVSAIHQIAEEEFMKVPYKTPLWYAKKKQLMGGADIGPGLFERFVTAEVERLSPDQSGRVPKQFTPRFFEFSFGLKKGQEDDPESQAEPVDLVEIARDLGYGTDLTGRVLLSGKIDRVDLTKDGYFGIVDYKTGIKIPSVTDLQKRKTLQLPLYINAFQKISGHTGVYGSYCHIQRSVKHSISLYDPKGKSDLPNGKMPRSDPGWEGIMTGAVTDSCGHVNAIHDGIFPIQASGSCSPDWYCPYGSICRNQPDRGSRMGEWMVYPAEEV